MCRLEPSTVAKTALSFVHNKIKRVVRHGCFVQISDKYVKISSIMTVKNLFLSSFNIELFQIHVGILATIDVT